MATPGAARGTEHRRSGEAASEELARIAGEAAARLEAWAAEEIGRRRRALSEGLNQGVRRMRHAEGESDWGSALVEAAGLFTERAAVMAVEEGRLRLVATRGLEFAQPGAIASLAGAPALAGVVETGDPVVAARSASETGKEVAAWMGGGDGRMLLFPVDAYGRVAAILYGEAGAGEVETAGLEMLASVAGAMLDRKAARRKNGYGLVGIGAAAPAGRGLRWEELSSAERELHLRAQRRARVLVAEMRLYHEEAVQAGRSERDVYRHLQGEIDAAREEFARDFVKSAPTMVDYLHVELLRVLANDEEEMLGAGYPGPLA